MDIDSRARKSLLGPALATAIASLAVACGDGSDAVSAGGFRDLPADQVGFNIEMDMKEVGVMRARLHADTAHIWEDEAKTVMFPINLRLYDDNGGESAELTAREGEIDSRTNEMVARGNVVLVSREQNRRLLTEELHYDPRTGRIWSDVHTVYYDGDTRMEGVGFRTDQRMHDVEVFQSTGENIPFGS